ncbi:DNA-directed RNA polymerase III subunit RPC5-like [Limulus polyphemus]|uniref:DNA-directed RNA polymerase III subunit RPC5-like n=1 Tax=Limulus polyphemus TaxID=6850 RepID=A0ABM1TM24_LIMPO|nr:DNA-directed RNA polymerase III subunit RPC5-like [Limulus polyphemus]
MDTDEEDEVVEEVDVYLSKALSENLYLFQYPVRPATMTYDNIDHLKARIKPNQQKLVMTDVYMYIHLGELHLSPLHAIVQLRPAFPYLDRSDARAKVDSSHPGDEGSQDEEEEAKAVTVRFAGIETEKTKQARERSYNYHQQQMASEPWTNVNFHNLGSDLSGIEAMMLQCPQMDQDVSSLPGTPDEYLKILLPLLKEKNSSMSQGSRAMLRNSPLPDQVKHLAVAAKVIQFSSLLELLPFGVDPLVVLRSLQQVAVLVQGCWVVKR